MRLRIIEIFESIQGESSFAGLPFTFVRLAGCNLSCAWCDTAYAIAHSGNEIEMNDILHRISSAGMRHVCITGGEPLCQNASIDLMRELVQRGYVVTLETNGSLDISEVPHGVHRIIDVKCPSSGMCERNRWENLRQLRDSDEIKFVIQDRNDFDYAQNTFRRFLQSFTGPMFVSAVHGKLPPETLAKWVLSDRIPFRVHLQIHKILNIS